MLPVTDQCVVCVGRRFEVSILDTSNGNIVKTIPLCHRIRINTSNYVQEAIECNSKFQLLSTAREVVCGREFLRILVCTLGIYLKYFL